MAAIIVIKCNTVVSKWTHERCQYEIEAWYLPNYNSNNMIENLRAPGKKEKGKSNNDYDYDNDNGHHTNHSNQTYHVFNRLLCGVVQMRVFGNSVSHKYSSLSLPDCSISSVFCFFLGSLLCAFLLCVSLCLVPMSVCPCSMSLWMFTEYLFAFLLSMFFNRFYSRL